MCVGRAWGVTPLWSTEANSGVRDRVRAAGKAPDEDDRQTDRHTHDASII